MCEWQCPAWCVEGANLAVDVRLFWKKDDDTWLPTKKGVRFLKRDVKVLVEALLQITPSAIVYGLLMRNTADGWVGAVPTSEAGEGDRGGAWEDSRKCRGN